MSASNIVVCPHCHAPNRVPLSRLSEKPSCGQCKQALFSGQPVELSAENFDRHAGRSDLPLVVDFWAPWCGPCRMMAPAFADVASKLEPNYRFAKVNTEDEQALAARFNIRSIPTLALFRNSREVARQSGAMDAGALTRWIQSHASH